MNPVTTVLSKFPLCIALILPLLFGGSVAAWAQSAAEVIKPISQLTAEELAAYIQEQQLQLDAVKKAREEQKAKHAEVQEALSQRQAELNQIVTELSELCSQRRKLDPNDKEPCLPDDS